EQVAPNPRDHLFQTCTTLEVREDERPLSAHEPGVARHDVEAGADVRGEVDLVDHEEIRTRHAGPALARDFVSSGDVDHIDRRVDQLGAEAGGQIVATGLQEHDLQVGVPSG